MQTDSDSNSVSVAITYPDGAGISFRGQGVIAYAAGKRDERLTAITGRLTLGDVAQLMTELIDSFGSEEICLALSLALVAHRFQTEDDSPFG